MEQEGIRQETERQKLGGNTQTINGIGLNEYAKMEQANAKNVTNR